jgi:hypothetical protein
MKYGQRLVTVLGTLPVGLTLDPSSGLLSGIATGPAQGGTNYDVQATIRVGGASSPTQGVLAVRVSPPVSHSYAVGPISATNGFHSR